MRIQVIIAIAVCVVLCGVGGLLYITHHSLWHHVGATYNVVLEQDGFNPSQLTIKRGDTIVFSTTAKEPYWPASDPHPIHSDHPEFDPRRPIQVGETWSYTFEKVGVWGFHNHLNSPTKGTVTVIP